MFVVVDSGKEKSEISEHTGDVWTTCIGIIWDRFHVGGRDYLCFEVMSFMEALRYLEERHLLVLIRSWDKTLNSVGVSDFFKGLSI